MTLPLHAGWRWSREGLCAASPRQERHRQLVKQLGCVPRHQVLAAFREMRVERRVALLPRCPRKVGYRRQSGLVCSLRAYPVLTDAVEKVARDPRRNRNSVCLRCQGRRRVMMGRQKVDQSQLFYLFNLEGRIPAHHLLRRINPVVGPYPGPLALLPARATVRRDAQRLLLQRKCARSSLDFGLGGARHRLSSSKLIWLQANQSARPDEGNHRHTGDIQIYSPSVPRFPSPEIA
jgi:hypothetical protein